MARTLSFDEKLTRCPLCQSQDFRYFDRDSKGVSIDVCRGCGSLFMNPQYTDSYLNDYYATYTRPEGVAGDETEERKLQKKAALVLLNAHQPGGRLLAVGCGGGLELEIARDMGYEVEGYDVDPATTSQVADRLGVPVHTGEFTRIPREDHFYDCIFLDQVLEHVKDPAAYLRHIHRLLKADGVVYFGVPNLASYSAELKTLQGRLGLKNRSRGRHYDTDHHLLYFKPKVLKQLLEAHFSFKVLEVAGDPRVTISRLRFRLARVNNRLCSRFVVIARPSSRA
jgi:2-polyprenyl-3-methyl-5-hydroxy-6-metoxy-1,4-benzoquinol methylase